MFTYQLQEEILEAYREIVYNKIPAKISRLFHGSERCRKVQYVHIGLCTYKRFTSLVCRVTCLWIRGVWETTEKSVCGKRNWRMPDQNCNYI